jgi:hypothetical protein
MACHIAGGDHGIQVRGLPKGLAQASGLVWDRQLTAYTGHRDSVPRLIDALRAEGMEYELHPEVIRALHRHVLQAQQAGVHLMERIQRVQEASGLTLRPYQVDDLIWMETCPRGGILGNAMRLGKSVEILTLSRNRTVVVCPLNVVGTWQTQAQLWTPWLKVRVVSHWTQFRWPEDGELILLHYEALPRCKRVDGIQQKYGYYLEDHMRNCPENLLLVLDESHLCGNPETQRARRAAQLVMVIRNRGGKTWQATGTPMRNRKDELWNLLDLGHLAKPLFGSKKNFFSDLSRGAKLSEVMVARTRESVSTQMPRRIQEIIEVELPEGPDRDVLDRTWEILQAKGLIGDTTALLHALSWDPELATYSTIRNSLAQAKIPAALKVVDEYQDAGEPLVVISAHRNAVEAVYKHGRKWGMVWGGMSSAARQEAILGFQEGKLEGMVMTIQAGGVGIDLSRAEVMLVIDQTWVPGDNEQAEERIALADDPRCLTYKRLVYNHPLEQHVTEVLMSKRWDIKTTMEPVTQLSKDPTRTLRATQELLKSLGVDVLTPEVKAAREESLADYITRTCPQGLF